MIFRQSSTFTIFIALSVIWWTFPSVAEDSYKKLPQCSHIVTKIKHRNVTDRLSFFKRNVQKGGYSRPRSCKSSDKVAIVVPFRNRFQHLVTFLSELHIFLIKQRLEYKIFIVEQNFGKPFNRAALMNVGFLEASKNESWDCFIFHDIDLIPMIKENIYDCPNGSARHMSTTIDVFNFRLPYDTLFGGVSAIRTEHFRKVNGFSNSFWGWGAEDDDMFNRLRRSSIKIIRRFPLRIGSYIMLRHKQSKPNPSRFTILRKAKKRYATDGLNSIKYEILQRYEFHLFTWFCVELDFVIKT